VVTIKLKIGEDNMRKCPNCQGECQEDSKVCGICGYKFEDNFSEIEIHNEESGQMNNELNNSNEEVMINGNTPEGNKGNKRIKTIAITAIVALIAIASVLVFGKGSFDKRKPEEKVVDAFKKYYQANTMDVTTKVSFTEFNIPVTNGQLDDQQAKLLTKVIKEISCDVNMKYDKKERILEGVMNFNVKDNQLLSADFHIDEELIGFSIPFLYEKPLFVTWESVVNKLNEEANIKFNYKSYLELLDNDKYPSLKNIDEDKYVSLFEQFVTDILGEVTKEEVKIGDDNLNLDKYSLDFDMAKTMEFYIKLLDEIVKDKEAKAFIYELIDNVSEIVIKNEDYKLMNITKEEFTTSIEEIKNQLEDMVTELDGKSILEKISEEQGVDFANLPDMEEMGIAIKYNVFIDKKDNIRKMDIIEDIDNAEIGMKMGVNGEMIINSINKKIEFKGINQDEGVNLLELNEEELNQLMLDIQNNVMSKIMLNPIFSTLFGGLNN
jgi:hypothetical protein